MCTARGLSPPRPVCLVVEGHEAQSLVRAVDGEVALRAVRGRCDVAALRVMVDREGLEFAIGCKRFDVPWIGHTQSLHPME